MAGITSASFVRSFVLLRLFQNRSSILQLWIAPDHQHPIQAPVGFACIHQSFVFERLGSPFLVFFRSMYDKFIYKAYTERFGQRLTFDVHQLYDLIEKFFNMYRHYRVVTKVPHFAH